MTTKSWQGSTLASEKVQQGRSVDGLHSALQLSPSLHIPTKPIQIPSHIYTQCERIKNRLQKHVLTRHRFLLRRAAARTLSSPPVSILARPRTFVTKSPSALCPSTQRQLSPHQRRFASSNEASPTEAQTSGETVTTEPTEAERQSQAEAAVTSGPPPADQETISQSSRATPNVADAKSAASEAVSSAQSAAESVKDGVSSAAQAVAGAVSSATRRAFNPRSERPDRDAGTFSQPKPSTTLYVGNLYFDATAAQLQQEFSRYGTIVQCKIAQDPKGLSKGFGYVEFGDLESSGKAVKGMDQQVFQGRRMAVQYHVRRDSRNLVRSVEPNAPSKTLFIGNMSFQMSDKDLNDLFRDVRNVLDVRVAIDRRSGQPRGFAHADFLDTASATKAKTMLEAKEIYGRQLRVDYSRPSAPSSEARTPRGDEE